MGGGYGEEQTRRSAMNEDKIEGQWKQLRGKLKTRWGKLTDDDLDVAEGNADYLTGKIQERYGIAKDEAREQLRVFERDIDRPRLSRCPPTPRGKGLEASFSLGASVRIHGWAATGRLHPTQDGPEARPRMKRGRVHPGQQMDTTARGFLQPLQELKGIG
jgi:uncharacterized protein YjbJ (UPF0337 family)